MNEAFQHTVNQSIERLQTELERSAPNMSAPLAQWMRALAGGEAPQGYFTHPLAFPTLLLPRWLEQSFGQQPDLGFHADLAYSSINGYYFIRMIDNVMDGEATVEAKLLPALAFFHTEFQSAYQAHFPPLHPFWALYRSVWFGTAQAAIHDARLGQISLAMFELASAHKVSAALIPVAAVCHRHGRADLVAPWSELVYRLGKWHQMFNDLFDWHKDSLTGNATYFLSQAQACKDVAETPLAWIVREGFSHGCDQLRAWMRDARATAEPLHSAAMVQYLDQRAALFEARAQAALTGFQELSKLASKLH